MPCTTSQLIYDTSCVSSDIVPLRSLFFDGCITCTSEIWTQPCFMHRSWWGMCWTASTQTSPFSCWRLDAAQARYLCRCFTNTRRFVIFSTLGTRVQRHHLDTLPCAQDSHACGVVSGNCNGDRYLWALLRTHSPKRQKEQVRAQTGGSLPQFARWAQTGGSLSQLARWYKILHSSLHCSCFTWEPYHVDGLLTWMRGGVAKVP